MIIDKNTVIETKEIFNLEILNIGDLLKITFIDTQGNQGEQIKGNTIYGIITDIYYTHILLKVADHLSMNGVRNDRITVKELLENIKEIEILNRKEKEVE